MVIAICEAQLKDRKIANDSILMLDLNTTMDQLFMANSVRCSSNVLRREDGHVLRMALDFEVEGQMRKGRVRRMWKKQVEEESVMIGLRREDALCRPKRSVGVN